MAPSEERPPDEQEPDPEGGQPDEGTGEGEQPLDRLRIPEPDPDAREEGKRYAVTDGNAPLEVTINDGPVTHRYAPAEFVLPLAKSITALLKGMSGGRAPMLYGMAPGSMKLLFGDADVDGEFAVDATAAAAERVAELIERDGEDLYAQAMQIGAPVSHYEEMANSSTRTRSR